MKSIRRAFVLLLAVLMLVGMALPVCAEELALGDETIVEDSAPETMPESEATSEPEPTTEPDVTSEPEPTTAPEVTPEPETTPEAEATPEPTATPEPVPADEAAPLALESAGETVFLTTAYASMVQGDTFRLTEDLDLSGKTVKFNADETVILDLNGHTLTVGSLRLDNYVTVTLTDSVGTGCINGPINVVINSTLVLNGGTVTSTETSTLAGTIETGKGTTVFNGPVKISNGTIISGGVFKGDVENNGTIDGGEFDGTVKNYLIISGGTFNSSVTSPVFESRITGGTFYGNVVDSNDLKIYGGVFYGSVPENKLPTDKSVYTVTFDLNGGSGSIPDQVFVDTDTAKAIKPATNPTRNGYNFIAWYKDGEPYNFNLPVTSSFTLKAEWLSYGYTINYITDGGTLPSSYPTSYATGITVTLPTPIRTGYRFGGWYPDGLCTGTAITTISASDVGNKTFFAKWTEKGGYKVTFDTKGGSSVEDKADLNWTSSVLPDKTTSKDGYTFDGWQCDGTAVTDETTYGSLAGTDTTMTITLTAKWKDATPPVINGLVNEKNYCSAVSFTVSDNVAVKSVTTNGTALTPGTDNTYTLSAVSMIWM